MRQENRRVSNRERGSMARFKVTESARSREGRILGLYGPSFGYRTTKEVISDLLAGRHVYFVREGSYESEVRVIEEGEGERSSARALAAVCRWPAIEYGTDEELAIPSVATNRVTR